MIGAFVLFFLFARIGITGYLLISNESPTVKSVYVFDNRNLENGINNTLFYWNNNLTVGVFSFIVPFHEYNNLKHVIDASYSSFSDHYKYGAEVVLGRVATMGVHGVIEVAGISIMVIGGTLFWALLLSQLFRTRSRKFALKTSVMNKMREDSLVSIVIGALLIVIAGPIEAFLSWPYFFRAFSVDLFYSIIGLVILVLVCTWVFFVKLKGWAGIKKLPHFLKHLGSLTLPSNTPRK